MNTRQTKHIMHLLEVFSDIGFQKYAEGTVEHPGNLDDMPLLELLINARSETIDLFMYLQTAIEKLEQQGKL